MDATLSVSVVIPVKDEEQNIALLAQELKAVFCDKAEYEVLIIDDGSSDGTREVLYTLKKGSSNIRILIHERTLGQSYAVLNGVRHAKGTWVAIIDGDGQNDPADIPKMLDYCIQEHARDADFAGVIGHRVERQDSQVKRMTSKIANGFRAAVLKDGVPDIGCGFKIVLRERYLRLPSFDHMHRFIPVLIQAQGGRMSSMPVRHRPRVHGKSKYSTWNRLWVGIVDVCGVWWLCRRSKTAIAREYL